MATKIAVITDGHANVSALQAASPIFAERAPGSEAGTFLHMWMRVLLRTSDQNRRISYQKGLIMLPRKKLPIPLLVSSCLAGIPCRYNGQAKMLSKVKELTDGGEALAVCPELLAGLSLPRRPAEILGGDGDGVLEGSARVVDDQGNDLTEAFVKGAYRVLNLAQSAGVQKAILKEASPSCGCSRLYDGTFSGTPRPGVGVTAALLRRHGIPVISEEDLTGAEREEQEQRRLGAAPNVDLTRFKRAMK